MGADLIITGARMYTVDPDRPWASALAVRAGRIIAIGEDADVAPMRDEHTQTRDVGGAFVMPGLVDAHNHHALAGQAQLYQLSFSAEASWAQIVAAVAEYAAGLDSDDWIIGTSWGSGLLGHLSEPGPRADLDAAAGSRPVILTDDSYHNRFVNSRALELAGITADSADPDGGIIVRDPATGEPTGLMLEAAGLLIEAAVRESRTLTAQEDQQSTLHAIGVAHSYGITTFQDAAISLEAMQALKSLDDQDRLAAWVVSSMTVNDQIFGYDLIGEALINRGEEFRSRHHRPDFIKIFLDGTPPAHSGAFLQPYLPSEDYGGHFCGQALMPQAELLGWLRHTAGQGISAKIHCTGDASVRHVLDAVEQIRSEGYTQVRYHIAHGQFIHPDDLPRLAALDVTVEISPFLYFPGVIADALATVRPQAEIDRIAPVRSLLASGALVAGGSDWPVSETPNAWEGIHGLVTRSDPHGHRPGQLAPDEAVSLAEAIEIFTRNGAQAVGLGDTAGSLEVGKSADFILLDRDPFQEPVDTLIETTVEQTWFAGRLVFPAR